jgi:hypothetical protein
LLGASAAARWSAGTSLAALLSTPLASAVALVPPCKSI